MLSICDSYARSDLQSCQNTIRKSHHFKRIELLFNNVWLQFSDSVTHLGHLLSYNLNGKDDIIRVHGKRSKPESKLFALHLLFY